MPAPAPAPPAAFVDLVAAVTGAIAGRPLDQDLGRTLAERFPPGSETFEALAAACAQGIAEGWLCGRAADGIRYGRALKPTPATHGFSVDVVAMPAMAGPHHVHPNGEIDLILPTDPAATFDGAGRGWLVYGPGSAHRPTVAGGDAVILYLLPDGAISFTKD